MIADQKTTEGEVMDVIANVFLFHKNLLTPSRVVAQKVCDTLAARGYRIVKDMQYDLD